MFGFFGRILYVIRCFALSFATLLVFTKNQGLTVFAGAGLAIAALGWLARALGIRRQKPMTLGVHAATKTDAAVRGWWGLGVSFLVDLFATNGTIPPGPAVVLFVVLILAQALSGELPFDLLDLLVCKHHYVVGFSAPTASDRVRVITRRRLKAGDHVDLVYFTETLAWDTRNK